MKKRAKDPPEESLRLFDSTQVLHAERCMLDIQPEQGVALCISGGGIRSATFGLGVLQGLAKKRILKRFHYLSTVSGGGYIGSWLSAWVYRKGADHVMEALANSDTNEPLEIRHLRRFSNYLTPKLGLLSQDTWCLVSIVIRNLLLNWLVLLPLLFAALLPPRIVLAFMGLKYIDWGVQYAAIATLAAVLCIVVALLIQCTSSSAKSGFSAATEKGRRRFSRSQQLLFYSTRILLIGAAILAPLELTEQARNDYWKSQLAFISKALPWVAGAVAAVFVLYSLFWIHFRTLGVLLRLSNALLLGVTLLMLLFRVLVQCPCTYFIGHESLIVCFLSPLFIVSLTLSGYLVTGLTHIDLTDENREWLSSLGGWLLSLALVWTFASTLALFGPELFYHGMYEKMGLDPSIASVVQYSGGAGAIGSAIMTALGGFGDRTTAGRTDPGVLSVVAKLGLPAFIVLFALLLSWAADPLLVSIGATPSTASSHQELVTSTKPWKLLWLFGGAVIGSLFFSRFIGINKFSLHAFYRNRLIRAYLGASNPARRPHPITGFDASDNLPMHKLRKNRQPLHVVNMALNLVGDNELAWQERKAESFVSTALFTGAERQWLNSAREACEPLGYRDSKYYGGMTDGPTTLGTAMAISGAAANPNMGYSSSPLLTFVLTLFNARLGWWLGNPGIEGGGARPSWRRSGPAFGLFYLLAEAFGLTTDKRRYVNLSDGGHFDNLGLYEMIRRECRHIVVIDAGCDGDSGFSDLGNAVRKCRIDFGVSIEFDESFRDLVAKQRRWVIARINYKSDPPGHLLYIKPMMLDRSDEPADVISYHAKHPQFPHDSTVDQFYSESQFESYRQLGLHTAMSVPDILPISNA